MISKKQTIVMPFLILITFMTLTQAVYAQDSGDRQRKTPEERAQIQTTWMSKNLDLDSLQVEKVEVINLKYAQKNEPILTSGGSKLSKLKAVKSVQNEKDAELKKVFTPDQFKKYESLKEEMREDMKEKFKEKRN